MTSKAHKILAKSDADVQQIILSGEPPASNLDAFERELLMLPLAVDMSLTEFERDFPLIFSLQPVPESLWEKDPASAACGSVTMGATGMAGQVATTHPDCKGGACKVRG
jgi:hypothetical protein